MLLPAKRLKTERRKNSDGTWRMYNLWQAPDGGTFREPVIDTEDDNCASSTGPSGSGPSRPPDPDYKELYGRRKDAEARTACSTTASGSGGPLHGCPAPPARLARLWSRRQRRRPPPLPPRPGLAGGLTGSHGLT